MKFQTAEATAVMEKLGEPKSVWEYFMYFLETPRESHHMDKVRALVFKLAADIGVEATRDEIGNVILRKPATPGCEDKPGLCLQAHMDIVADVDSGIKHNFQEDPVRPRIVGPHLMATGTSLGADNGIGLAAIFAILADNTLKHGNIEALLTVDEETGLEGAAELPPYTLGSKYLINVDSEEEYKLCVGCAGGYVVEKDIPVKRESADLEHVRFDLDGFLGGHTGVDIAENRANPLKVFGRIMKGTNFFNPRLVDVFGGSAHNAIPRTLTAEVAVPSSKKEGFIQSVKIDVGIIANEFKSVDPDMKVTFVEPKKKWSPLTEEATKCIVNYFNLIPFGPLRWSPDVEGLVETSYAVTKVEMKEDLCFVLGSGRSSSMSQLTMVEHMIKSLAEMCNASRFEILNSYPGWAPAMDSHLLKVSKDVHKDLFSREAGIYAIHAGLECGLIMENYPNMEAISVGPQLDNPHSTGERLLIESVPRFYELVKGIVVRLAE